MNRSAKGRIVYEVNITINDPSILAEYSDWLESHIAEMLEFDGFETAEILTDVDSDCKKLSTRYVLENEEFLQKYLAEHAAEMRADGVQRFGKKFTATRRILTIEKHLNERRQRMDFKLDKILAEVSRMSNVNSLKKELSKVTQELKMLQRAGASQAKQTMAQLEKRYNEVVSQFSDVQNQLDSEFSKALKSIEKTRQEVKKAINDYKKKATDQKKKLAGKKKATKKAAKTAAKKVAKKVAKKAKTAAKKAAKKVTKKAKKVAKKTTRKKR